MKNRQIKFRAYWKGMDMIHFDFDKGEFMWAKDGKIGMFIPAEEGELYMGEPIIMQYTGLKDKNGKEIYEGDIVSFTRPAGNWTGRRMTSIHKIYFEEHICAFVLDSGGNYIKLRNGTTYEYEVLGNIYENDFEKIKLAVTSKIIS